nr:cold shock domain-containing protein [Streptomyces sp. SID13726]
MVRGKVVRFDEVRGYGFIRPEEGGEDVFMHANDLIDEKYLYQAGSEVEFSKEHGEKGLKASEIRLVRHASPEHRINRVDIERDDDQVDLLSVEEFRIDLTEALLHRVESLTAGQIREVRTCVIDMVRKHGWVVDD